MPFIKPLLLDLNLGAGQINNALQQLNQVTQQNAATSEEMAASAEELSSQADQLKEIISFFKFDDDGKYKSVSLQKHSYASHKNGSEKKIRPNPKFKSNGNGLMNGINLNMDVLDEEYEKF